MPNNRWKNERFGAGAGVGVGVGTAFFLRCLRTIAGVGEGADVASSVGAGAAGVSAGAAGGVISCAINDQQIKTGKNRTANFFMGSKQGNIQVVIYRYFCR